MEKRRRKFQGVVNILSFNRHFYSIGLIGLGFVVLSQYLFTYNHSLKWFLVIAFTYGLVAPLVVSAYVYDFSRYYDFNWIDKLNLRESVGSKIVNMNAGFDETSYILKEKFQESNLQVFDFYDEMKHTEQAIKIARKVSSVYPNTNIINTSKIPLEDTCVDFLFLLSAAHEIRSNKEKITFFKECSRVLKNSGKILVVEHLRDVPNFLAFSIGFTHFFSKKTWKNVFEKANLKLKEEIKFTPFVSVFVLENNNKN
ncbi:methyltransferase domain-containing protein [Tenacibaculum tangerinum]|uniref:Methyltransferase domain-containing protein n=1 Tax=Tenacibaculum tangerinum TaxID=3038772 RepID=A0ABY8L1F4_9FLAO|nr:methyltransferase domain-containing protein [Tenacibaculum tangerinum]WGH75279.1 methyltransferase domain-containing protein [Tenacibaculum tangerinum]